MKLSSFQTVHTIVAFAVAALGAAALPAASQAAETAAATWRCGNTYTDQPCKGGKAVDLDDARDAAQRREAVSATRDAQSAADRMERDRVRAESTAARRQAVLIDNRPRDLPAAKAKPDASKKNKKGKPDADTFSAHDPVATARNKAAKKAAKSAAKS